MRDVTLDLRLRAAWLAGLSSGLLCIAPTHAQTASTASTIDETGLEVIVVTAQKRSEDLQKIGTSIQAFTGKELDELGIKTSSDLGQFAANVEIALPSGAGNQPLISIRGIGLNDFSTNNAGPNGVYLDEVYLSAPASQTFSVFDLQGVEVLKGPQGTLYGRNTNGGAINIVTVKPSDEFSANMHLDYGSFNTLNVEGAVGGPLTSNLDGRIALSYSRSEGYVHNLYSGENENGLGQVAGRGMLLFKPIDHLKILFNVHGGQIDNRPTVYRFLGSFDPATLGNATPTICSVQAVYANQCTNLFGYPTQPKFYDAEVNRQQHLRVTNAGSYVRIDYDALPVTFTSISAIEYNNKFHPEDTDVSPNRLLEIDYGVHSSTVTQEFRASQSREQYNWVAGLYYLHENLHQNQPLYALQDLDLVVGIPGAGDGISFKANDTSEQVTDAFAGFGQVEYQPIEALKFIVGGRVTEEHKWLNYDASIELQDGGIDHYDAPIALLPGGLIHQTLGGTNFSWLLGVNYNFTPDIMAYGKIATGYKSGDFNGGFLSTDASEINRQLVPARPEKVKLYETGIKSAFLDNRLRFNVAVFYNEYRDIQVFTIVPPVDGGTGLPLNVLDNAPKAHTEGLDINLDFKPISALTLSAQIGVLRTRLDEYVVTRIAGSPDYSGNELPFAPHISGTLMADYKIPLPMGSIDVQANANYKGHIFMDTSSDPYIQQNGYWIGNARVAYTTADGHWEAGVFVHNLTNNEYYTDKFDLTGTFGFIQAVTGIPRMFGAEINWRY